MSMLGRQSPDERDERLGGSRTGPAHKEENIYIPQFITKRPFYTIDESEENAVTGDGVAGASRTGSRDYLEHQRMQKKTEESKWYQRGKTMGPAATKYRKGACENCGSMSHKRRDCFSRPRAKLAKYTNEDIQPDEVIEDVNLSWDAKRDRWIGFDPRDYAVMMAQREKMNEAKRVLQEKITGSAGADESKGTDNKEKKKNEDIDETRYAEDADMGVSRKNGTADLRMREDTARYLVNLDVDSAKYDPKRRKIVDGGAFVDDSARLFAEQNFAQASGDAEAFERAERYAWEVHDKTGDASLHLQANPTAAEHRRKQDLEEARRRQKELDDIMLKKYGVTASGGELIGSGSSSGDNNNAGAVAGGDAQKQSQLAAKKKAALLATAVASSEHFIEYDESGQVKDKYQAKRPDRSKYPEDVFPLNHTAVWGSWWNNFQWGYACCYSSVRNSYCTGEEGRMAWERAERQRLGDWGDDDDGDDGGRKEETREPRLLMAHGEEDAASDDGRRRRQDLSLRKRKPTLEDEV